MSRPVSEMMEAASSALMPVASSSRAMAGRAMASGPVPAPGPVAPSASMPQAARMEASCSHARVRYLEEDRISQRVLFARLRVHLAGRTKTPGDCFHALLRQQ
jgi:hypothetical protein